MPEGVPPQPTSVPPKTGDGPTTIDSRAWGADGKSPADALGAAQENWQRDKAALIDGFKKEFKRKPKGSGYQAMVLEGTDDLTPVPQQPEEPQAPETPFVAPGKSYGGYRPMVLDENAPVPEAAAAPVKKPKLDRYRYQAPQNLEPEDLSPYPQTEAKTTESEESFLKPGRKSYGGYRPMVLEGEPPAPVASPMERAERAKSIIENAGSDELKQALAEQMLKPSEMKRYWKNELFNSVSQLAVEKATYSPEGLPKFSYKEFTDSIAKEAREKAVREYANLKDADDKYEDAYKRFFYNNNVVERIFKRIGGKEKREMQDARLERDKKRVEAREAFVKAAREKWEHEGKSPEYIKRALAKYENLHMFKDIINPGAQRDAKMRAEALGEKVPDSLEKGMTWFARKNEQLNSFLSEKLGIKDPKVARAVASAIVFSAAPALIGTVGTAGLIGGVGFGIAGFLYGMGRFAVGTGAAEAAGAAYRKFIGKRAQENAVTTEVSLKEEMRRLSAAGELTAEKMAMIEKRRLKLMERASDEVAMRKLNTLKMLTALGVTTGPSVAISAWEGAQQLVDAVNGPDVQLTGSEEQQIVDASGAGTTDAAPANAEAPEASTGPGGGGEAAPAAPAAGAEAPPQETPSLTISGNINNADRLVGHFGLELQEAYPDLSKAPPSVQQFVELLRVEGASTLLAGEDKATHILGLQENGLSAIMQPGDTISLTPEGEIVLDRPGAEGLRTVLVEADGTVASDHNFPMESAVPVAATEQAPAGAPSTTLAEDAANAGDTTVAPTETAPSGAGEVTVTSGEGMSAAEAATQGIEVQQGPGVEPLEVPQQPETIEAETVSPEPAMDASEPAPQVPAEAVPQQPEPAAPEAPSQPEGAIDYTQPFTNINGLDIDPREPAVYIDGRGDTVVFGGTTLERTELAQQYALEHPGVRVLYDATTESIYGIPQPILGAMVGDAAGRVTPYSGLLNQDFFRGLDIAHPNDLVREVPFTPTPRP